MRCDLVLEREDVGCGPLVTLGPQLRARLGIDQLDRDAQPIAAAPYGALDDIADAEFPANLATKRPL